MTLATDSAILSEADFAHLKQLLYRICGIDLKPGKEGLVKARLGKRLQALGLNDFSAYLEYVEQEAEQQELSLLVDAMTTNKTSFFREAAHFDFLSQKILPQWRRQERLMLWSAACSSGEEPFTLAMVLNEALTAKEMQKVRILATDISSRVLHAARQGVYDQPRIAEVPPMLRQKYFTCIESRSPRRYRINPGIAERVCFARLNLLDSWPMQGPFDAIFCRNAMIYFDKQTQAALIRRFYELLTPGGYLFIGHSESLTGITHDFRYVQPALYVR
jgi:chemotaxis protein methyltransferase CheR